MLSLRIAKLAVAWQFRLLAGGLLAVGGGNAQLPGHDALRSWRAVGD